MGARLFCSSLPEISKYLRRPHERGAAGGVPSSPSSAESDRTTDYVGAARLELTTCTLLHPEHDLHTFIERDYDLLHECCKCVTLYMDRSDQALKLAELFNGCPSLGKHPFALVPSARQRQQANLLAARHRPGKPNLAHRLRGYDQPDELSFRPTVGNPSLDLDVIDTSWMDTNTQGPRHSYFNVNRWLIDDLAEVITTRKRAASRPHRLVKLDVEGRTHGNVWVFLAAPSWIGQ